MLYKFIGYSFSILFYVLYLLFRNVEGIRHFLQLEELILDNNEISDEANFPTMSKLHTLTINKNNVSLIVCFVTI